MTVRLEPPFRASVAAVRANLELRERTLFDLLCCAGQLCYRLPHDDINLRHVSGAKDPRNRLARDFARARRDNTSRHGKAWARAGDRLVRVVANTLASREGDEAYRALRVLLAYAPGALAPDCTVPTDPVLRAAWKTIVRLFAEIFPSTIRPMGRLKCVDSRRLAILKREAAAGLRVGRRASGQRAGPEGRKLAVDPRLIVLAGKALRKRLAPGYQARNLFYANPGDHFWPHPDDPKYAAQLLLCIDHEMASDGANRSAFLAYRPDGSVARYELAPGDALVVTPGFVHGREPVQRGERVILLSIGLSLPSADPLSPDASAGRLHRSRPLRLRRAGVR